MPPKQQLYNFCKSFVEDRVARIQKRIKDVQEALASDTKSSAGDKHETSRAMLQLEREKLGQQLAEAEKMRQILAKVDPERYKDPIGLGSCVKTSKADYFLAISAGEYKNGTASVFCISTGTPIGQLLMGKSVGDTIKFNNEGIKILSLA